MIEALHPFPCATGRESVLYRPASLGAVASFNSAVLPSITGSNPGTRAASLAFHRHTATGRLRVSGIRLALSAAPSPLTIRLKAAIYRTGVNGLPDGLLDSQLASSDVAFSSAVSTAGFPFLDIPFPSPVAIHEVRPLWIGLMSESFYTATDVSNGQIRGSFLRGAISGPSGSLFDRDLSYIGAGVTTIASGFPSGIGSAANFANAADGSLANALCGLILAD